MPIPARLLVAAIALAVVVAGGAVLLRPSAPGVGSGLNPPPSGATTPRRATSSPAPALTITTSDVGKSLPSGTYRVEGFAAPFSVTLPGGWTATEFRDNSINFARTSDRTVNVYVAIMGKVYPNPCHPERGLDAAGSDVDDLVTALSSMDGFVVTDVSDATVGGASGKTFTVTNEIDAASNCSGGMLPIGTYLTNGEDVDIAMFPGETDQFWVLAAGGTRVFMAVTDKAVEATREVRDSLVFHDG